MDNSNSVTKEPFDPGWNDPPKLSYNTQQTTPNRPRNFLNKRVAFPLSGNNSNSATPPLMSLPTLPPMPSLSNYSEKVTPPEYTDIDSESVLIEVKGILMEFLNVSSELGTKASDIRRRLDIMEEMWSNKKLNQGIHMQMKELACALRDDQPAKADEIHKALMVDHISAVGTWMPGVKQLIHHCAARSELLAIDKE